MVRYNKKDRTNFADDDDEDGTLEEGKKELFIMWSFIEKNMSICQWSSVHLSIIPVSIPIHVLVPSQKSVESNEVDNESC